MGSISCGTNCFTKHPFNRGKRKDCEKKKSCVCGICGPLKSLNLNLYEGCKEACSGDEPPKSTKHYKCDIIGKDFLFRHYQIVDCGFDPKQSEDYKAVEEHNNEVKAQTEFERNIVFFLGLLILAFGFWILVPTTDSKK